MSAEPLTLEQLPGDALLAVMQYLCVDDLFACRLVCKRLCGLALDRDVWCRREVDSLKLRRTQSLAGLLRLAPCVGTMVVRLGEGGALPYATTTCPADRLILKCYGLGADISLFTQVVRNQEALGRLRTVVVEYVEPPYVEIVNEAVDVLLRTLVQSSSLESLEFANGWPISLHPFVCKSQSSSLKKFRCELLGSSEWLVNAVLGGHAATLEDVDIGVLYFRHWAGFVRGMSSCTTTVRLLVSLPRLRRLRCAALPGLEDLVASEVLTDLTLLVYDDDSHEQVVSLLQRANQLRRLSLVDVTATTDVDRKSVGAQAVEALASSGRSRLESLSLIDDLPSSRPLLLALPRLAALRELTVCDEPVDSELLQGISPVTAPTLRRLEVHWAYKDCAHAWLHSDAMGFLARNPMVHLQLQNPRLCGGVDGRGLCDDSDDDIFCDECDGDDDCSQCDGYDDRGGQCVPCARRCHPELLRVVRTELWALDKIRFLEYGSGNKGLCGLGLFGHDIGRCPSPQDHIISPSQWRWIHVPPVSN
ncbi:uncharacterized protein LOC113202985 [Frankliniella occidentalis]|uniref:Uncharacterized protein LOC113202985 n=1 Tax=Frankliniella occidentalis TaxID=133901 RepID=A0A6J1RW98_FRAOC|nr:uncharacterized protein LOC113202985 [Frankliniella occidentalis]XP_052133098.1 uncharacterized protein LOC113202985 [Frankliniella occidentalis]XP_052133099.1 uncharacterized protein LOC113202985 [Frankliniella occidentalis]